MRPASQTKPATLTRIRTIARPTCQAVASPVAIRTDMRIGANGGKIETPEDRREDRDNADADADDKDNIAGMGERGASRRSQVPGEHAAARARKRERQQDEKSPRRPIVTTARQPEADRAARRSG